jgi:hypothetical protein
VSEATAHSQEYQLDEERAGYAQQLLKALNGVLGQVPYFGGAEIRRPEPGQPYFEFHRLSTFPGTSGNAADSLSLRRDAETGQVFAFINILTSTPAADGLQMMRERLAIAATPAFRETHTVEQTGVVDMRLVGTSNDVFGTGHLAAKLERKIGRDENGEPDHRTQVSLGLDRRVGGLVVAHSSTLTLDDDLRPVDWRMQGTGIKVREVIVWDLGREAAEELADATRAQYDARLIDPTGLSIYDPMTDADWVRAVSPDPKGHRYMLAPAPTL